MKKYIELFFILPLLFLSPLKAQTVFFDYDEAGNQIYRGLSDGNKAVSTISENPQKTKNKESLADKIGNKIKVAPVPVKTDLSVIWDLTIKDYIVKIDLLPYNAFWILETVHVKSLTDNSYIFRMSNYPYGVYYLKFYLSDGSIYTRTVTKN